MRLFAVLSVNVALFAQGPTECILDLPVYSSHGRALNFNVVRVSLVKDKATNLLGRRIEGMQTLSRGHRVTFSSRKLVGGPDILVNLRGPSGERVQTELALLDCNARRALVYGESVGETHAAGMSVRGRLTGCNFDGDWWVSAGPLFGESYPFRAEALVTSSGKFTFGLRPLGVRHALLIGFGAEPVRVLSLDLSVGDQLDAGTIDLRGACPSKAVTK